MDNTVTEEQLDKYEELTSCALKEISTSIVKGKEEHAKEIIDMATNYLTDAKHFRKKGKAVTAFAALNYAHGWIDSGVRLNIFDVTNRDLFTVR